MTQQGESQEAQRDLRLEEAMRALFQGDRSRVIDLLQEGSTTGAEFWLLASAVDGDEERLMLLRRTLATGEQPYADLAADILRREANFAFELAQGPAWQHWLVEKRDVLLRIGIAIVVFGMAALLIIAMLRN